MREDAAGLYVEITPPDTQAARDLITSMQRGDINQMSFAFTVAREDQTWTRDGTGPWLRTIKKVSRLYDVSVVTYPAYQQTTAAARALAEIQDQDAKSSLEAAQAEEKRAADSRARHLRLLELSI
jgi:HK97 family phage prohead protease